jgi:hypothetical protein
MVEEMRRWQVWFISGRAREEGVLVVWKGNIDINEKRGRVAGMRVVDKIG